MLVHELRIHLLVDLKEKTVYTGRIVLWFFLVVTLLLPARSLYAADTAGTDSCDFTIEIIAAPYAVVDSNMPGVQGPQMAMLGARITNRSASAIQNFYLHLGNGEIPGKFDQSAGSSLALKTGQSPTQHILRLGAGETETYYWAVTYPPTTNVGYNYTVWLTNNVDCKRNQGSQIKTQRQISASANKLLPTGSMVVVSPTVVTPGSVVKVKIIGFTLGTIGQGLNSNYDAWLQPVGNPDFDPSCLRFAHSEVKLNSISATPFVDQLYFTNLKNYRRNASDYVEYHFVALRSCTTPIYPYQEAASGTQQKYNDDYAAELSRINVVGSRDIGLKLALAADKAVAGVGEKVHFQADVATITGQFGVPGNDSPAVITVPLPTNSSYASGSATASVATIVEYSTNGGQSWLSAEPPSLASITHLRWLLKEPLTTVTQAVAYDVVVTAVTNQCVNSTAALGLLNAQSLLNASTSLNCPALPTPTPTPTPSPTPIATLDSGVQSGGEGGLESGPLPGEPSAFVGAVGVEGDGADAADTTAVAQSLHKARLLQEMQIRLEDFIPTQGPAGTTPKAAVPVDVLAVTDAPDAKAVDFVNSNGQIEAVALGILSLSGPYEHDYGVCNRFKEYVFDMVEPRQLPLPNQQSGWFWYAHATKNESRQEDALLLTIFVDETNKQFHIDSQWIKDNYPQSFDFSFDYVFTLQLWSNELAKTQELLAGILTKLGQLDNGAWQLIYHNQAMPTAASLFVKETIYHADQVQLSLWNRTSATQAVRLYGSWRSQTERNTMQPFDYTLELPADESNLNLVFPGLLDATIYVESNGFTDKIYQGGGLWFSVKGTQVDAPAITFGQCRQLDEIDTKDLLLAGCAEVTTAPLSSIAQAGLGRTLNPNGRAVDISPYKALRFWAKGDGTPVRVILETASVTNNDYYQTVFRPDGEWRQYMLPLTQFTRSTSRSALVGTDVKAVIWLNAEGTGRPMTLALDSVSFTNQELLTIVSGPQDSGDTAPRPLQVEVPDNSSVASVLAYYSLDGGTTYQSVPLAQSNGRQVNSLFQGELPGQPLGADVLYYLETTYTNGYSGRTPIDAPLSYYRYRVDDRASLLVNDFAGPALQNRLELGNGIYNHPSAGGRLLTYHVDHQLVLDYDVSEQDQFVGYFTYLPSLNATAYTTLDLLIRGEQGGEQMRVGLRNGQNVELFMSVGDLLPGGLTNEWQWVQIPLRNYAPLMDLSDLESMSFFVANSDGATQGRLYVREIRFTTLATPLVIDNFEDANLTANAQMLAYWSTAPNSTLNATLVAGDAFKTTGKALQLNYTIGANGYAIWTSALKQPQIQPEGVLTFWAKGASQPVPINLYLTSANGRARVALQDYVTLSHQWQRVEIPLSAFAATGFDLNALTGVQVIFEYGQGSGVLWLDNIQLGTPGALQANQRLLNLRDTDQELVALHLPYGGLWQARSDVPWLFFPTTGVGPTSLTVNSANWTLAPGLYTGTLTFTNAAGQTETVTIQLRVTQTSEPATRLFLPMIAR